MHCLSIFLGGNGVYIVGIIIVSGKFDWVGSGKFPTLTEPYEGYHGLNFADEFGTQAFLTRARAEGMKDFGACLSPANAFYILQGIESLPLRMQKHVANAQEVAEFLEQAEEVEWVTMAVCESCASPPSAGLLGLNVSQRFHVSINHDRQAIALERRRGTDDRSLDIRNWIQIRSEAQESWNGSVHVELQDGLGSALTGYTLSQCRMIYGDDIEYKVCWDDGAAVSTLAGKPIRLRFILKDADLYSFKFGSVSPDGKYF